MTRIEVFHSVSVTLFISILAASSLPGAERSDLPNIVIIMADDMGYGDVRTLNPVSGIPTPNLDALAKQGMTFVDGHSPSAVCTPTRYALLTGRYCWRSKLKSGVLGGYSPPLLEDGRRTIADMLQGQGYRTAAVGKWHLGMEMPRLDGKEGGLTKWDGDPGIDFAGRIVNSPIHHGFDEYFGVSASLDMAPFVYIRNDRFTMLPTFQQKAVKFPHFVRSGPRAKDFVIADVLDRLTKEAVGFIDRSAKQAQPFFLYMPLTGPHKPTQPHERFRGKTKLNEYGDFVTQVDWTVGQISAALDR
ncbi:MAG: sulfatase-like hydrolase/transferase, partial [Pirellulaceae bacterium]